MSKSCSGFLHNTSHMQPSCSHYNAFYSITWQTRLYLCTWQKNMTPIMKAFQCDLQLEASFSAAKKTSVAAPAAHTSCPSPPAAATLHGKTQGFTLRLPPQHTHIYIYILYIYHATFMQPLQCVLQHDVANPHVLTRMATKHAFHCDLQPQIPKHPITAHTQTHPKQLEATVTARQKKTSERSQPHPPHTRAALHRRLHAATLHGKTQGFMLRLPPQHKSHATFMQPLQCVLQHDVANPHVSTHMAIKHAFHCDLQPQIPKHPTTAYTHKRIQSSLKPQLKRGPKKKRQNDPSRTRRTRTSCSSSPAAATLHGKNARFRAPASSPAHTHTYIYIYLSIYLPCNIHAAITMCFTA